jgi:signal transduction histidine kinase
MSEPRPSHVTIGMPLVSPPPPFVERRVTYRREADRIAHRETVLLARALDILASDTEAESRLAGLLGLLASTVGARRAAVLANGHGRRVAVANGPGEDPTEAHALAAWLDAWAPRPRAQRAASGPAPVAVVSEAGPGADRPPSSRAAQRAAAVAAAEAAEREHHYAFVPIPSAGGVVLGFDFPDERGPGQLDVRLPPHLARHAAVALALVTDQVATERELSALRARDDERTRFVSNVAHELRTPLTGLSGYLELILGGQVEDPIDERDFLERSRHIVGSISDLVGDLLELSRLESGTLQLQLAPFSVAEAGSRVVAGLAPIALARAVELRTSMPPRLRAATGDRRRVEQILTNLLGNALKYAPSGSTIELGAWFAGQVGLVTVRDEGRGIAPDDRARIFERFYRMAGQERITGTGLGLPIARDLARAMGGDLDVASVPGSGSTFILALPGAAGAAPEIIDAALTKATAAEEVRLEERAVLRAIAASARAEPRVKLTRPKLVPGGAGSGPASGTTPRRARLRSIDGMAPQRGDPSPA